MMISMLYVVLLASMSSATTIKPTATATQLTEIQNILMKMNQPMDEFPLPNLPFAMDALEPHIDTETMRVHHSLIFSNYTEELNKLMKTWRSSGDASVQLANTSFINILQHQDTIPDVYGRPFGMHAVGYYTHLLYFATMSPPVATQEEAGGNQPSGELSKLLVRSGFPTMNDLREEFVARSGDVFGSGWVFMVRAKSTFTDSDYLTVMSTLEEMVPIDKRDLQPVLALDLWEHAYFRKNGNCRASYIHNWWNVVDWSKVETLLDWWRQNDGSGKRLEL